MKREVEGKTESAWPIAVAFLLCILIILAFGAGLYHSLHKCPDRPPCKRQHEVLAPQPTIELSPEFLRRIDQMQNDIRRLDRREIDTAIVRLHIQNYCIKPVGQVSLRGTSNGNRVEVEGFRVPCE